LIPLVLNPLKVVVGLAGQGPAFERRLAFLTDAGAAPSIVPDDGGKDLRKLNVLYVAGLERAAAERLSHRARTLGLLVNLEDEPDLSDFHVPGVVRRGELLLTVSSAGRSPGLVKVIREWLSDRFGSDWGGHVAELGRHREEWRAAQIPAEEISRRTRAIAVAWFQ